MYDRDRLHLWMGLSHPYLGPMNMAWYSAFIGYAWYLEWVKLYMNIAQSPGQTGKSL